jgi:CheY-like chemotaxis protein
VAEARSHHPDLVLLDLFMPVMDGFRANRALKGDPATRDVPVALVTAYASEADPGEVRAGHLPGCGRNPAEPRARESVAAKALPRER